VLGTGFRIPVCGIQVQGAGCEAPREFSLEVNRVVSGFGFQVSGFRLRSHLRVDARQSQKSIPQIFRGIDVRSKFPLPLT
jgi:hypothetical protein